MKIIFLLNIKSFSPRFRDMFEADLKGRNFLADYSRFSSVFTKIQRRVEEEAKLEKLTHSKPRSFEESVKSTKSVKSMIVSDNDAKTNWPPQLDQRYYLTK